MKRIDKEVNAYRAGLDVGQLLVEGAIERGLALEGQDVVLDDAVEQETMQLLCAAGHLYKILPVQEYTQLLSLFFRGVKEKVPDELAEYEKVAHTWYAGFFAWGVSLYILDSLEEWDAWLFDHGYIDADTYAARMESEEESADAGDETDCSCAQCSGEEDDE